MRFYYIALAVASALCTSTDGFEAGSYSAGQASLRTAQQEDDIGMSRFLIGESANVVSEDRRIDSEYGDEVDENGYEERSSKNKKKGKNKFSRFTSLIGKKKHKKEEDSGSGSSEEHHRRHRRKHRRTIVTMVFFSKTPLRR
ncbi:unnamed protein product [Peronospora belbahrii]|uniref:RxLR effector protein n=1 Tax=Peronospora belbahrii TaxID=622444 RepID=A0AAU9L6D1_9STRA|nr:unnamed protein product [Peronospora belbahrii]